MKVQKGILQLSTAVLLFSVSLVSQAALIGLTGGFPDFGLASDQIFTYDANCDGTFAGDCSAGQGKLTISGTVGSYTEAPDGTIIAAQVTNDAFFLQLILDIGSETVVTGSTSSYFTLDGIVRFPFPTPLYDGSTHPSGHLLSGDLNLFGYAGDAGPSTGGTLDLTFNNADGYIANGTLSELGDVNFTNGGMILTVGTSSLAAGTFGSNLLTNDWTGTGLGDVFVVPIPAAIWLFGSGLLTLLGFTRARHS